MTKTYSWRELEGEFEKLHRMIAFSSEPIVDSFIMVKYDGDSHSLLAGHTAKWDSYPAGLVRAREELVLRLRDALKRTELLLLEDRKQKEQYYINYLRPSQRERKKFLEDWP